MVEKPTKLCLKYLFYSNSETNTSELLSNPEDILPWSGPWIYKCIEFITKSSVSKGLKLIWMRGIIAYMSRTILYYYNEETCLRDLKKCLKHRLQKKSINLIVMFLLQILYLQLHNNVLPVYTCLITFYRRITLYCVIDNLNLLKPLP